MSFFLYIHRISVYTCDKKVDMSNNTPHRSQRLATQHDTNPYNVAARKALNKPERQQACPYTEYNQAVNNLANSTRPVQPAHKPVTQLK